MSSDNVYSSLSKLQNNDIRASTKGVSFLPSSIKSKTIEYQTTPPFEIKQLEPRNNKDTFGSEETIRFTFPKDLYMNPSTLRLYFNFRVAGITSAAIKGGLTYDINTLFRNIKVTYNTLVLQNNVRHDLFSRIHANLLNDSKTQTHYRGTFDSTQAFLMDGQQGITRRTYLAKTNDVADTSPWAIPRSFCTQLPIGIFLQERLIPLPLMSDKLGLDIDLNKTEWVVVTDDPGATLTTPLNIEISNIYLEYVGYRHTPSLLNYENKIGPKIFKFHAYDHFSHILRPGHRTLEVAYSLNRKRVMYAVAVIRSQADEAFQWDTYNFYHAANPRNNGPARDTAIREYQWNINNTYIPETPVKVMTAKAQDFTVSSASNQAGPLTLSDWQPSSQKLWCPAPSAYTYLEKILNTHPRKYLLGGQLASEMQFTAIDKGYQGTRMLTASYPSGGHHSTRTGTTFTIGGKFSDVLPDGNTYALNLTNRDIVRLRIEFNGINTTNQVAGLTIETFFVYESHVVLDVDDQGFCTGARVVS